MAVEHVYYPDPDRSCLLYQPKPQAVVLKYLGENVGE